MISMRYADNLVRGYGLVWNPGERVEGNTNFGWTLLLALVHLVPAGASAHCLLVQILGVVMLWGCLAATAWLARATRLVPAAAIAALVLTGLYYNLMFFALMGMETGFFTALVTCGLARSVQALRSGHGAARGFLWFALAGLVRPEAVPLAAVVVVVLLCQLTRGRVLAAAGFAAVVLVQISLGFWRLHYYGQWFPNTYYLKGTGWPLTERLPVGLWQAVLTVASIALPLLLASAAIVVARRRGYGLLAVTFCFALAYEAYVGGDAWPLNRFVIPTLPAVFVLAAQGLYRLPVLLRVRRMQSAAVLRLGGRARGARDQQRGALGTLASRRAAADYRREPDEHAAVRCPGASGRARRIDRSGLGGGRYRITRAGTASTCLGNATRTLRICRPSLG